MSRQSSRHIPWTRAYRRAREERLQQRDWRQGPVVAEYRYGDWGAPITNAHGTRRVRRAEGDPPPHTFGTALGPADGVRHGTLSERLRGTQRLLRCRSASRSHADHALRRPVRLYSQRSRDLGEDLKELIGRLSRAEVRARSSPDRATAIVRTAGKVLRRCSRRDRIGARLVTSI
jgi:hypothetical protein